MLLSIIVPMYNSSQYLETLFSSIDFTSDKDMEIILIDDGSKDDTYDKCIEYKNNMENVIVIHNTNHGVSYSRNCGIQKSSGKYIMFVDSDDKLSVNWYDIIINTINEAKDSDVIVFSENSREIHPDIKRITRAIIGCPDGLEIDYLTAPVSKVYRRDFILDNKIEFDTQIIHGEDALFNIEVFLKSNNYYFDNKLLYSYFINYESSTHRYNSKFLNSNEYYYRRLSNIFEKTTIFQPKEITIMLNYTFSNSIYIYVGRVSKIARISDKRKAVKEFYCDLFHKERMEKTDASKGLPMVKRFVYWIVKHKLFFAFEIAITFISRKKNVGENYWINL